MTQTVLAPIPGLYAALLGDSWSSLAPCLQRLHCSPASVQARGVFQVRRGTTWLARVLATLAGMPKAGDAVDLHLVVSDQGERQEWRRVFAGKNLVSLQGRSQDGMLVERMGMMELRFRLEVIGGALSYQSTGAALCLASLRLPLPRWLRQRVAASERAVGERIHVSVDVNLPLLGRLIRYEGELTDVKVVGQVFNLPARQVENAPPSEVQG